VRLTDEVGLFEHADRLAPRPAHGYCVDDVARGLVVVAREPDRTPELERLGDVYLDFVLAAVAPDGRVRNRRAVGGAWTDEPSTQDCWGRAIWGLGTAMARQAVRADRATPAAGSDPADITDGLAAAFDRAVRRRSPHLRAMAFAAMGAAEVLAVDRRHAGARALLADAARLLDTRVMPQRREGPGSAVAGWPWPEPRLRYANGVVPETLLAAGTLLDEPRWVDRGLEQLEWLLDVETAGVPGALHRSVTPVAGWVAGEPRPGFDQQPLEVAALADASARALALPGDPRRDWGAEILCCEAWFDGDNDLGVPLLDAASGGGYDGLTPHGRNENEGAESTLALLTTLQQANRVRAAA
jgi:hypothetical protein